jgi:hypothetical protein
LTSLYNTFHAAGIKVVFLNQGVFDNMHSATFSAMTDWLKTFAATRSGVYFADAGAVIINPTGTVGPRTYCTLDGVHYATDCGYRVGMALAQALTAQAGDSLPPPAPRVVYNTDPINITTNPMLTGSSGTVGTGASGVVPSSWTLTGNAGATCAGAVSARTDGFGQMFTVTMTGTGPTSYCELKQNISGWAVADRLQVQAEILTGSTIGVMISPQMVNYSSGSAVLATTNGLWQDNYAVGGGGGPAGSYTVPTSNAMLIMAPTRTVPTSTMTTTVSVVMYGTGSTVNVGRVEVRKR